MYLKVAIFTLCVTSCLAKFPSDIPQCKAGDLVCIPKVATEVIRKYPGGRPDIGFPAYDPFIIYNLTINEESGAPINMNLFLKRAEIRGLSQSHFESAVGWEGNPNTSKHELHGTIPKLEIKGDYKIDGKIMLLPIKGEGEFHIVLDKIKSGIKFKSHLVEKDGHHFLKIQKIKCLLEPSSVKIKLTNLFDGNKQLGDSLNTVLNENWKDAWGELAPAILDVSAKFIKDFLQEFLDKYEFDDFYLPS